VRFSPSAAGIVSDSFLYGTIQVKGKSQTAQVELRANVIAPQSEFYIGQVDGIIGGDTVSNITANMLTEIERGREITLVGENKGFRYTITTAEDVLTGESTFAIEEQFIEKDIYHIEASQNADRTGITVSEREIVLKVKSDGKIAAIRLSADADSATTEIDISADQVKINDIIFTQGVDDNPGNIATSDYDPGLDGWKIDGDGSAEFNNVVVRGSLFGGTDAQRYELTPTGGMKLGVVSLYEAIFNGFGFSTEVSASVDAGAPGAVFKAGIIQATYGNHNVSYDPKTNSKFLFRRVSVVKASIDCETGDIVGTAGTFTGALSAPLVAVTSVTSIQTPYTVLATDTHIAVDNGASPFTVNLPAGTNGRKVTIFDSIGTASSGLITIDADGAEEINGAGTTTLTTDYQSVTLLFTGGNWTII
jgi:hypothetical protein